MRIIYGVNGYGRGHATRALAVLPALSRRHSIWVFAGGDAYSTIASDFQTVRIPTLGYCYGAGGSRSALRTVIRNAPAVLDLLVDGPACRAVLSTVRQFRPDVVISDAEPWTHFSARRLGIPRIGFDHFGIMVYCKPEFGWRDVFARRRDAWTYRLLMGQPDRVIVSSFYDAPAIRPGVRCVGPLLRETVLSVRPRSGGFMLAYFNNGVHQWTQAIERTLKGLKMPLRVYGTGRRGVDGNVEYRPPSNLPFIEDLAACHAVVSTAGNQLVGEAIHFGKPMLVMPEHCPEQRLNANAVERLGIGMQVAARAFNPVVVETFLDRHASFVEALERCRSDGRQETLDTLETFIEELSVKRADFDDGEALSLERESRCA